MGHDRYRIRDFKTGRIFDEEGSLLPEVSLQLRLYALLLEALHPGSEVLLTIDTGGEDVQVDWNASTRAETVEHVAQALNDLAPNLAVRADQVAHVGSECRHCPVRHRCSKYLETAPIWWIEIPAGMTSAPADTWGRVVSRTVEGDRVALRLQDAAGRLITVADLRHRPSLVSVDTGDQLYFFGLEKTGSGIGWNGRPFQPHAFHEVAADRAMRPAWVLEIFSERSPERIPLGL